MLHTKDQIRNQVSGVVYNIKVTGVGYVTAENLNDDRETIVIPINDMTGNLSEVCDYVVSHCPHTTPEPPTSPYATRLIEQLAYNNGLMESRLEEVWREASRLADPSRRVNPYDTHASWARLAESIRRTADLMRPRPNSDGTEETTSLFNLIYSDRK